MKVTEMRTEHNITRKSELEVEIKDLDGKVHKIKRNLNLIIVLQLHLQL